jgi:DNA primase
MSKQSISKLTTDKDAKGNNIQKLLTVEGPICVSGATTQGSIYEDNANRSFLLHIDESSNHLNQVMEYQRKIQAGIVNETGQQAAKLLLKNAQRLLRRVRVINPYATDLRIPDCVFKKLRTNMHYLKLIEIITFYNQYQRKWKKSQSDEYYIETAIEDIELANWLVKDNLLRKSDELNEDTRYFFESLKELASEKPKEAQNFYAKEIRQHFRMNPMKVNRYLHQLESRGYINRTGGNRKTGYEYEVAAWEEYELLKSNIDVLDEIIQKIRAKYNGKSKS